MMHKQLPPSNQCSATLLSGGRELLLLDVMEYPFGQFQSAVLILSPPSSLGPLLSVAFALYNTV